jgi:hypothetical protein
MKITGSIAISSTVEHALSVVPITNILMFGNCLETHTYCQAKRESFQRAICLRCLADVVFSYMAAVEAYAAPTHVAPLGHPRSAGTH